QGVRREALARRELLRQREEGPVREVVAVDEEELGVAHGRIVELKLGAGQGLWAHRLKAIVPQRCRRLKSSHFPRTTSTQRPRSRCGRRQSSLRSKPASRSGSAPTATSRKPRGSSGR